MVGTEPGGRGGIGSVIKGYIDSGIFDDFEIEYVSTHIDNRTSIKAVVAIIGWSTVLYRLVTMDAPLLHIHTASRASFWRKKIVCLMARVFRRPYLLHVHGGEFFEFFEHESGRFAKRVIRNTFRDAGRVLALSKQWKSRFEAICPAADIMVVPNSVPLPDLSLRSIAGDSGAAVTILFLGRLTEGKGVYDLIRAFSKVLSTMPTARLVCAGDGDITGCRKLAADLQIENNVSVPGWLDHDQCREQFRTATLFVLPSYAEGVPISVLEAMSWRVPVVTCPVGGIPELIEDGKNGLLIPPGSIDLLAEAIFYAASNVQLRNSLATEGRLTIELEYSDVANKKRLGQLYRFYGLQCASS